MQKYYSISLLRALSIFIIIIYHALIACSIFVFNYYPLRFFVQCFLFISGFLYYLKKIETKSFLIKNYIKILLPLIILIAIYIPIVALTSNSGTFSASFYTILSGGRQFTVFEHLWYIYAILLCYLSLPLLQMLKNNNITKNKKTLIVVLLILLVIVNIFLTFSVQLFFLAFFVGFYFNHLVSKNKLLEKKINWKIFIFSGIAFILFSLIFYLVATHVQIAKPFMSVLKETLASLVGISFSVLFLVGFNFLNKLDLKIKFLDCTDNFSYFIYLTHMIFVTGSFGLMFLTPYAILNFIIYFIAAVVSGIGLYYISNPIINKTLKCKAIIKFCSTQNNQTFSE